MFKIICTVFAGIFIALNDSPLIGGNNMIEYIKQLLSNWVYILSLTSVIMCIMAAWYFDWFGELRYSELRLYAKRWEHEYKDVSIKSITLHKFYSSFRKEFERHHGFGVLKAHYVVIFELDCSDEDFNIETAHGVNNPCKQFIADTEYLSTMQEHPKYAAFIDSAFFTVYKRLPPIKNFRDEWYFVPIKYKEKPPHTLPTIKKWVLYPDCRIFI